MGDRRKPIPTNVHRRLTKNYVSKLPDRYSGMDLAEVVGVHADIYDIYIARKRDKLGNRFGFISLLDVKDTVAMEKKLSDIRMGDFKLCFNVARFTLEDGEINNRQPETMKPKIIKGVSDGTSEGKGSSGSNFVRVRSFKDAILGRRSESKEEKVIDIKEDFKMPELGNGKAVIARMKDFKRLKEAENLVRELMVRAGIVQYVGGMYVLVSFSSLEEVESFLVLSKEKGEMFHSTEKWIGQSLPFERIAWLRVQGIPLHLLDNSVINQVEERFGKIVQGGLHDDRDSDLSFDYVGVLVAEGKRIQEEVVLQWKGRRFRVWVEEEVGDWVPDLLTKEKRVESITENINEDQVVEGQVSDTQDQFRRPEEESPINRNSAQDVEFPNEPFPSGDLERPFFTYADKESSGQLNNDIGIQNIFSKNLGDDMGTEKECEVVKEGRSRGGKNRNISNKGGRSRVGFTQPKLISVDDRPTSRKRPRLDVDPSGLDPFGLDVLLGLHQSV
ncbi:hypothetical protein Hdeb2414_s0008g00293701 [Helianthus debilis subsp. tardiflorus]